MARFSKIPPIFDVPRAEQADGSPQNFEPPDNVPAVIPANPIIAGDQDHGDHAQPVFQPAPPAELLANYHAILDVPGESIVGDSEVRPVPTPVAAESIFREDFADFSGGDHPETDLPDQAAVVGFGDVAGEFVPEGPHDGKHDQSDARPERAAEQAEDAKHDLDSKAAAGEPETDEKYEEVPDFAQPTFQDIVGLPLIFVDEIPPETGDDAGEVDLLEFFL
jgi:hypothetical protein